MSFASYCLLGVTLGALSTAVAAAQSPVPEFAPNPAVGWLMTSNGFQPAGPGAGPVRVDPLHPGVGNDEFRRTGRQVAMPLADLSNPILQPWTREELRKQNEIAIAGKALSLGASCWPIGAAAFMTRSVVQPYYFIQAPDKVVIVEQHDGQFRHIYLTHAHSANVRPSWSGESIGHYEADELVVDTIGISGKGPMDKFFTPHTDQLHMIERFRLTDGGDRLEVRVHVEDPGAFTVPWDARISYARIEPGRADRKFPPGLNSGAMPAGPLVEMRCAENPFSYFGNDTLPIPQASKPDF